MWNALKGLLSSKKALLTLGSVLVWVGGRFGLDIPAEELYVVVGSLAALVVAYAVQDAGKEAAKLKNGE